jgi:hypothetical protein
MQQTAGAKKIIQKDVFPLAPLTIEQIKPKSDVYV